MFTNKAAWFFWLIITIGLVIYLVMQLNSKDKTVFLPGKTSHGHHQIEMACSACHTDAFGGKDVLQNACMSCHGEELKIADDSHPKSKFTDPRNADRVTKLDARACITCHVEHQEEITLAMGVTVPEDFCFKCHEDVAEERPSHAGLDFYSCATAGCHNFHDNRALYEDFLEKHLGQPTVLDEAKVTSKSELQQYLLIVDYPIAQYPIKQLNKNDIDAPSEAAKNQDINRDWLETAHAEAGVNCTACHTTKTESNQTTWTDKPTHEACATCHKPEQDGFLAGKHGMRLAQNLTPMKPALAKIEMKADAHYKEMTSISCHSSHRFDIKQSAVASCLSCHNDQHSLSYKKSLHYVLWQKEIAGQAKDSSGVSCATCHMPRITHKKGEARVVISQHNQNDNLRPNEKMLRSVCMSCHGLEFSIDALADTGLIKNNFSSSPGIHVESMDMVRKRVQEKSN